MATVRNVTVRLTAHNAMGRGIASAQKSMRSLAATSAKLGKTTLIRTGQVAALSALAGAAAQSAASLIQLAAAIAPVTGLLTALPGVALTGATALVALKLAVAGFGDAMSAALSGNQEKFDKALQQMGPAARRAAIEFKSIVPALLSVRNAAQAGFWGPLRGEMSATAAVLAGPLRAGFQAVAQQMGSAAADALRFIRSAQGVASLQTIFGSTTSALGSLRAAFIPLLKGFLDLGTVGARFFASLSPGIAAAAQRFGEFLSKASASGRAMEWMQTGLAVLKQLATIIGNVGSIIGSVFKAANATGGGLLNTIGMLTGKFAEFLKSSEGVKTLQAIFSGVGQIGKALAPVVIALAKGIGTLAPAIGRIAIAVGPVLTTAINAVAPALAALEPGITALIKGLGGAVVALAPALVPIAQAIAGIAVGLAPILPALGQLIAMLALGLAKHITSMLPVLPTLVGAIIQLGFALGGALLQVIKEISPYLPELVKSFADLLIASIPLIKPLTELVIAITPLIPVITDIIVLFTQMMTAVMPLLTAAIDNNVRITKVFVAIVKWAWGYIYGWIRDRVANVKSVIGWFGGLPEKFRSWFGKAKDAAGRAIDGLVNFVSGLPGRIGRAVGNLGGLLWGAGRDVMTGLWNGIASMAGWIAGAISSLVKSIIPGPVRSVLGIASPSRVMAGLGVHIAEGLAVGMTGAQGLVARAAEGLAGAAVPAMAGGPAMSTPVGVSRSAGAGAQQGIDIRALAAAFGAELDRRGIGATYLDGQLISDNVSRRQGRAADQRRRTG
jgi:phage-related protein